VADHAHPRPLVLAEHLAERDPQRARDLPQRLERWVPLAGLDLREDRLRQPGGASQVTQRHALRAAVRPDHAAHPVGKRLQFDCHAATIVASLAHSHMGI
jgi:hypothetical protein